ncbi:isopeptide-forming domain-containing fimbrial protein [Glycomyces rhizosphaerae]|uniref:Isopeptide-forming domain-containing fimbrial protein n=1 Tax=Glycomyces rhizosphaerae TaxID=2054422 RepID=A0ABV7Q1X3_9ACTN
MGLTARLRRVSVSFAAVVLVTIGMLAAPVQTQAGTFADPVTGVYISPTGHPDLCLTASSANAGGALTLRTCGSNDTVQRWTITTDDRIQLTSNTQVCLGNPANQRANNTPLLLTTSCSSGANNATWPYQRHADPATGAPAGGFINTYAGVCMAVKDSNIVAATVLVRHSCDATAQHQQFSIGSADMEVTAATNPTGKPGAAVEAQLQVENLGPQTAHHNSLTVTADTGLTVNSLQRYDAASTGYADCTVTSSTAGSCPAGSGWTPGDTGYLNVNTTIPADAVPGTVYEVCGTNTITPTNDSASGNDTGCAEVTVDHLASDLAMSDTTTGNQDATTMVDPGATAQIPFTLTNNGDDTADIPEVTFAAPTGFTLTAITGPTGWTCDTAAVTCTGPTDTFTNTATAAFTVTGTDTSGLAYGSTIGDVTATASVAGRSRDGLSDNDTATNTLAVDSEVTIDVAKTGAATADPGHDIEYTVTVTNGGSADLIGATVTDTVPSGIEGTSWSCTVTGGGSCGPASGIGNDVTTTVDVPAGEQAVITIRGTPATAAAGTTLTNTAAITMPSGITNRGAASASIDTPVSTLIDIEIESDPIDITPGTSGTVKTTVKNNGPDNAAEAATVTLDYPDGLTVSNLDQRCTDNGDRTATCTVAALGQGASTELAYTAAVPADADPGTTLSGLATLSYDHDSDNGDNTAEMRVLAADAVADFDIAASAVAAIVPGESGTVTFTTTNNGPSTSPSDATVTLRTPADVNWDAAGLPTGCAATSDNELACTIPAGVEPGTETDLTLTYTADPTAAAGAGAGTALVAGAADDNAANDAAEWQIDIAAASADLGVDKAAPADTVSPGDEFSYTLTVDNAGPSTAADTTLTDTLPAQLTFVSATGTGTTCDLSGQTVTCTYAQLAPGTHTVTLTVRVDAAYTGTGSDLPNSAAVTAVTADPDTSNNTSGTVQPAIGDPAADLALTKRTTADTPVAPGETFTYLLDMANNGPSAATGAVVTDTLPSALAFVSSDSGCTGTAGAYGGTVTCSVGTLGAADEAALLVTVRLDPAYAGTGSDGAVTSAATAGSDIADPDGANSTGTASLPGGAVAAARADLSVSIDEVTAEAVVPGESVMYTITVANDGPSSSTAVEVTDTLPNGMAFASSPDGCTAAGQSVTCPQIASLAPGSAVAFGVLAYVDAGYTGDGGDLANAANASSPDTADPDTSNNTDSSPLPAGGVTAPSADLSITKSSASGAGDVAPGESFTYTLAVTNHGPSDASDVAVTDVLPASVAFVSADGCTGTVGDYGGTVTCGPLGAIPAASGSNTVDQTITVSLNPLYTGTGTDVVNTASVSAGTADPDSTDNSTDLGGVPSLGVGIADMSVAKAVVGSPTVAPGESFDYRISVSNAGPSVAVNPTVTDTLGAGMSWEAYPSDCVADGQTLTCSPSALGALQLPVLGTATFDTTVTVDPGYTGGTLSNTATVAADTADSVPDNNSATTTGGVTVSAPSADIETTTTLTTAGEVAPGGSLDYRISVHNAGPSDAADVTAVDELPDGLAFADSPNGSCTADGQTVTCGPTVAMAPGDTVNHLFRVIVDPDYTGAGADLGNSATATSSTADPDTANNTSAQVFPSISAPSADLRLTKELEDSGEVTPGETFRYALTATNAGPSTAQDATVTDTLDEDLAFVSSTPDDCTAAGQTVTCGPQASMPVGSRTIVLTVRLSADYTGDGSDIANSAAVTSGTADPDGANNTGTVAAGTVSAAAPSAGVSLTMAATGTEPVAPGGQFDYAITVANAGPSTAAGVAVTGTLPAGLDFVAGDDCTATGPSLTCTTIDSLAVGAQTVHTVTVAIDPAYTGSGADLVSTATAMPATADPDSADNTGTATVPTESVAAPSADVSLANTVLSSDPVIPGQTFDYRLTIHNAGPSVAGDIAVTDTLPASLAFVSGAGCTGSAEYGATVTCAMIDSLAVDGDVEYTLTVRLDPAYSGTGSDVFSTAAVAPATADPDGANNSGTATVPGGTTATPQASVSIAKAATGSATAGGTGEFTVTVANAGPSTAQAVTVNDTLPDGLTFVAATGAPCTAAGAAITCDLDALAPGDQTDITITVDTDAAVPDGTVLTNTAEVTTSTANTSGDTTAGADIAVNAEAGLSLAKSPPTAMTAGETAVFTFTVNNDGPSDATDVTIAAELDPQLSYVSAVGATCAADTALMLTCDVGSVDDGATASVDLTVLVAADTAAGTRITTSATLATATDNTSTDTTAEATGPPVNTSADLSMLMVPLRSTPVAPGETFPYRLRVTNNGPSDATNPVVADQLPAALSFVSSPGGCTGDAGVYRGAVVTCQAGATLPAGDFAGFTILVKLHPALTGTGSRIVNRATATSDTPDPESANNTAGARLPTGAAAAPRADLSVAKTLTSTDPVTAGDTFNYTITIANAGPSAAAGFTFTDTLPEPLSWVQSVPPAAACRADGQTVACATSARIPVGFSHSYTLTVALDPDYTGNGSDLVNTAAITSATADPNSGNNTTTATAPASVDASADLMLTTGFAAYPESPIAPGETTDILLSLNNYGSSSAADPVVTETLPLELAFDSSESGCAGEVGVYGGTVTCATVDALDPGEAAAFIVTVRLDSEYVGDGSDIEGIAVLSASSDDADPQNNTAVATMAGGVTAPDSDVQITKSAPDAMVAGEEAVWTITVANDGPSTATGVTITDDLDPRTAFVSASPAVCSATGQRVTCDIGSLEPDSSFTVDLTVAVDGDVDSGDIIANTASVEPSGDTATAVGPPVQFLADLAVTKTFDPDAAGPITPGTDFDYLATVDNLDASVTVEAVTVTDAIPAGLAFVEARDAATGEPVDCTETAATVVCPVADALEPDSSATIALTVELDPSYRGDGQDITNTVTVSSAAFDPDDGNDTASVTGVPGGVGDPVYDRTLTVSDPTAEPGGTTAVDVVVESRGPSTLDESVTVTIGMPERVGAVASELPPACTATADRDTVACEFDTDLAPSAETDMTGPLESHRELEATAIAEADPAAWSASILVQVDADAPEEVELTGGTVVLNADANEQDGTSDADTWTLRTMAGDGNGNGDSGSDTGTDGDSDGALTSTGGDVLAMVLTGLGAIVMGLVVSVAAARRRERL